jgi:hypothetical protein
VELCRGLDAMHGHVLHTASACVHAQEHMQVLSALWARSTLTERRPGGGIRIRWSADGDWVARAMCLGACW